MFAAPMSLSPPHLRRRIRAARFAVQLTSLRKPCTQPSLRSTSSSKMPAFVMSSGIVVSLRPCKRVVPRTELLDLGSSAGRGTRTAAWFNDHIQEQGDEQMQSVILAGGIKGWATAGGDFVKFMDGYVPGHWAQFHS